MLCRVAALSALAASCAASSSSSSSGAASAPRSRPLTPQRGLLYHRNAGASAAAPLAASSSAAAPAPLRVDDEGESWPTEHHDARNSGYTSLYRGPSDAAGICRAQFFKDSPVDPSAVRFYSVGVNNVLATDNVFFFGGT